MHDSCPPRRSVFPWVAAMRLSRCILISLVLSLALHLLLMLFIS